MSKGEEVLLEVLKEEFPHHAVLSQHTIKIGRQSLYLDYYIPRLNLAFEYDGFQHFSFTKFYHKTIQGFKNSQMRDNAKTQYCHENGITLIRIPYNQEVTTATVRKYINHAINPDKNKGAYIP